MKHRILLLLSLFLAFSAHAVFYKSSISRHDTCAVIITQQQEIIKAYDVQLTDSTVNFYVCGDTVPFYLYKTEVWKIKRHRQKVQIITPNRKLQRKYLLKACGELALLFASVGVLIAWPDAVFVYFPMFYLVEEFSRDTVRETKKYYERGAFALALIAFIISLPFYGISYLVLIDS